MKKKYDYYGDYVGDCEECLSKEHCHLQEAYRNLIWEFNERIADYDEQEQEYFRFTLKCINFK